MAVNVTEIKMNKNVQILHITLWSKQDFMPEYYFSIWHLVGTSITDTLGKTLPLF